MALSEQGSRKRYRANYEDEISEFMPLSKRINNLHINNSLFCGTKHPEANLKGEVEKSGLDSQENCGSRGVVDGLGPREPSQWNRTNYSPDLTPTENPYYYESNRLLFQLHLERTHRQPSSPSVPFQ